MKFVSRVNTGIVKNGSVLAAMAIFAGCPSGGAEDDGASGGTAVTTGGGSVGSAGGGSNVTSGPGSGGGGGQGGGGTSCVSDGDPFAIGTMQDRLTFLASVELAGRAPGTPGDVATRDHIEARFRCLGLTPGGQGDSYQQPFINDNGAATANVVGFIPGSDLTSEIIVIGAHHDHLGEENGELHLGANDNASGITGLLAIAQAFQQRGVAPRRTVAFVAFGAEETLTTYPYVEGSAFYVDNAPPALPIDQTVYMINMDMIGTYSDEGTVYAMGTFAGTPARTILDGFLGSYTDLGVDLGEPPEVGASDFYPFCLAGVPYVFFWTDDYTCYHQPCDTADRIDYPHLSQIARVVTDLGVGLADSDLDLAAAGQGLNCGE